MPCYDNRHHSAKGHPAMSLICPLCSAPGGVHYEQDQRRTFYQCQRCALVFADPDSWPDREREKAEYDRHENHPDDAGYQRFLGRMSRALDGQLGKPSRILDFGCGPAPVLADQLSDLGHEVGCYDVFYFPDDAILRQSFDAIVMTEVIEHLHQPGSLLKKLSHQLNPGGLLAIMTQRVISPDRFRRWNYKNDPTHVCFYSEQTFQWLATRMKARLVFEDRDLVFLTLT